MLLTGRIALAQQANSQATNANPAASESLAEIVVTAQKREERLQDVPISITAISGSDLARNGVETTHDLPSVVSGLVWSNQGAWIEPNLRGVYTNVAAVGSASPIAIYLDGVYQPLQSGTITDLPDVSRIEVSKGPQGTLFGRNASGGAISIYTLDPSFTPTGKFSVSAGDYDGSKQSGHYNISTFLAGPLVDDTLAGSFSASYDRTDGYLTDDVTGGRGGEINSAVFRGKLLWKISDAVRLLTTVYYEHRDDQTTEAGFPQGGVTTASFYPPSVVPTQPWHYAFDGPTPTANLDSRGASIKAMVDFDAGTLTSITAYQNYDVLVVDDGHAAYSPGCVAAFDCIVGILRTPDQVYSQEFDFASKQMGMFRYVAGLFALDNDAQEQDVYNSANVYIDNTSIRTISYAAFAEGTADVTDQFSVVAGLRVNKDILRAFGSYFGAPEARYADKNWTSTTPRVSLVYKINSAVNTYFTYSQGFKAGIVSGQSTTAPAANPEKIYAYEVGLKAAQENYSLDVAAFYYDYRDLQVEVFDDQTLATEPLNAARAEITGLDIDGTVKLTHEFQMRLDATYLPTAKYKSFPNAVAYLPPLSATGLVTDNNYNATGSRMLVTPVWTGTLAGTYTKELAAGVFEGTASLYHSGGYRWSTPGR
jgi:iron complex outermembrane receptor protein